MASREWLEEETFRGVEDRQSSKIESALTVLANGVDETMKLFDKLNTRLEPVRFNVPRPEVERDEINAKKMIDASPVIRKIEDLREKQSFINRRIHALLEELEV